MYSFIIPFNIPSQNSYKLTDPLNYHNRRSDNNAKNHQLTDQHDILCDKLVYVIKKKWVKKYLSFSDRILRIKILRRYTE